MGIKIVSIQYGFYNQRSREERMKKAERLIDKTVDADLILLPELWNFGWNSMF